MAMTCAWCSMVLTPECSMPWCAIGIIRYLRIIMYHHVSNIHQSIVWRLNTKSTNSHGIYVWSLCIDRGQGTGWHPRPFSKTQHRRLRWQKRKKGIGKWKKPCLKEMKGMKEMEVVNQLCQNVTGKFIFPKLHHIVCLQGMWELLSSLSNQQAPQQTSFTWQDVDFNKSSASKFAKFGSTKKEIFKKSPFVSQAHWCQPEFLCPKLRLDVCSISQRSFVFAWQILPIRRWKTERDNHQPCTA